MYNHFIVNENRKQENCNEIGAAEPIRGWQVLRQKKKKKNEAYSRRVDREAHQRPFKGMAAFIIHRMLPNQGSNLMRRAVST